jgi:hypothetical protein
MVFETMPTQSFSLPRRVNITTTMLMIAIAIMPIKMVATKAANDSTSSPYQ